jgi:hypothetical protein
MDNSTIRGLKTLDKKNIQTGIAGTFPVDVCNAIKNPNQKLLYIMLAHLANINEEVFPSIEYLVKMTNLNRKTVLKHLMELEKNKFIKKNKRYNDSTIYKVRRSV